MFIGLHNHTDYSNFRLKDSTNRVVDLINYTHQLGHKGVAITEHECITSSLPAIKYYLDRKKDPDWRDYKLILGNEIYLCPDDVTEENKQGAVYPHFILLALDAEGHKQLRELSTIAWSHSFMNVIMRVPTYYEDLISVIGENPGHVVGMTACLGGTIPRQILLMKDMDEKSAEMQWEKIKEWVQFMKGVFGEGKFFLEMQPSYGEEQIYVNKHLLKLSLETQVDYVITTDSHYLTKEDAPVHHAFITSQDGDREADSFYASTYVMSEEEIHEYLDESLGAENVQIGLDNTMKIYDMAEDYDLRRPLHIPYVPDDTREPDEELFKKYGHNFKLLYKFYSSEYDSDRHLCRDILEVIENDQEQYANQETYDAVDVCLDSLLVSSEAMNVRWSAYLLQVADFVDTIWEDGDSLVGAGRGSGVGFILLNMLGITQINPLRENTKTYPFRFLNPERVSVLDIDIDIMSSKRDQVVQAFQNKYGKDRISKVMTLSTEGSKNAILTACRGLGVDSDTAQYLASFIVYDRGQPRTLKQTYFGDPENDMKPDKEFVREMNIRPDVWSTALKIEGLINGVGSHAGGIILTDEPFTEVTAQMKTNSGDIITQFDLHMCEDVSLIKFDLLSVDCLDKMRTCLDLLLKDGLIEDQGSLKKTYEKYIGVYTLERDSKKMWEKLWNHEVISFFQMEKESGIKAISLAKPNSVDDLATLNSVIRLMAQEKGAEQPLDKFARFKEDITQWYAEMDSYGLTKDEQKILIDILGVSYGICEAQEYLMILVQHPQIGGFSLGWADRLRKAVGKKKPKEFLQLQEEFFANAKEKKLSKNLTNYVWNVLISTQRGLINQGHVKLGEHMQKWCVG